MGQYLRVVLISQSLRPVRLLEELWSDVEMPEAVYRCAKCGREVKLDLSTTRDLRCPYCGSKILYKPRPKIPRRVKAI
ncbi:77aa long hypothetical DNA-directed RNA polymerase [Pyrococcus horikoshii OT3]|nr:77aa long hypothetical DNA-directed RNA polymerase [Pyrococcus horikoshii OT3]